MSRGPARTPAAPKLPDVVAEAEVSTPKVVPTPPQVVAAGPVQTPVAAEESAPRERYWTEDRIIRVALMALFALFAVGLVVTLATWDVIARVPFLPWLVGAAILAGPAWKGYTELLAEQHGARARAETQAHGLGVIVSKAPQDRSKG